MSKTDPDIEKLNMDIESMLAELEKANNIVNHITIKLKKMGINVDDEEYTHKIYRPSINKSDEAKARNAIINRLSKLYKGPTL